MTAAVRAGAIALDGRLDEPAWSASTPATGFRQQDPNEGQPATQRTEIRILHDEDALFIGARMYDTLGARGVRTRLARRDDDEVRGDYLELIFDTFHDHTGRTLFRVNPSGVKYDAGQAMSSADPSWDPIWEVATSIDEQGWTAEFRIPLAQLRFARDTVQTWGMQVWRYVERLNELSMWSFWGKQESGGTSFFGHVDQLRLSSRARGVELLPYVVYRATMNRPQDLSPFVDRRDYSARVGGDLKALLGSSLTLDVTINPDFGQVEVDPAVVNLSAFETFFEERRPFFIEGSGLFGFGGFSCYFCSNVSSMSLFYSRRIGRTPAGSVPNANNVDRPENTTILGAAKVTGRTRGGWQIGVLDALTRSEDADVLYGNNQFTTREIEPMTNFFVGRVRRLLRGGNLSLGAIGTSVIRRFDYDSLALQMPRHAEALGMDWTAYWNQRRYRFMGNFAVSQVYGAPAAITRIQESSARYFQRPDRDVRDNGFFTDGYDPTATHLRGYGGYARVAKEGGAWLWETAVNYRSPGFEANDVAFLTRSDYVWMSANVYRQWTKPTSWYRRLEGIIGGQQQFNYDGILNDRQAQIFGYLETPQLWDVAAFFIVRPELLDERLTRNGPVAKKAGSRFLSLEVETDSRKRVELSTNPFYQWFTDGARAWFANLNVRVQPASNVEFTVGPAYEYFESRAQFVRSFNDTSANHFYDKRVVFADLEQTEVSMNTRLNVTFTPTLTFELFAQPFISSGEYTNFKEFTAPRTIEKVEFDAQQLTATSSGYALDPDRNPSTTNFTFDNPDFNARSLRGNAVLRWEYRPGSTLFVVWQQERSSSGNTGSFNFSRDRRALFEAHPRNIFLVKVNYWFPL
jgi:hypothetical protein